MINYDNMEDVLGGKSQIEDFHKVFDYAFKGNGDAIELCFHILYSFHVWDDMVDKDVELGVREINTAFRNLIDVIPMNPIMRTWGDILYPMLYNVYVQWIAANEFESKKRNIEKAYMLRAALYQFFIMVAKMLYGADWADSISFNIFDSYSEKLEELETEVLNSA